MASVLVTQVDPRAPEAPWVGVIRDEGHHVTLVKGPDPLLKEASRQPYTTAFLHIDLIHQEPLDLIRFLKSLNPHMEIVILTGIDRVREAVQTIYRGASFYLLEPIDGELAKRIVTKADRIEQTALLVRDQSTKSLEGMFGESPAMARLFRTVLKVAPTDATILVTGESGTGKELLAQVIHRLSQRSQAKFVAVNCAAIPDTLLESELFGHVKGAFTGALIDKRGLIEEADGGTCFFDEVGELPFTIQAKLLRFLQDRILRRVGGLQSRRVDVRILAATNRDLAREIRGGTFREDLFYRLNVINLHLPPLRERKETIPGLVQTILARLKTRYQKSVPPLSAEVTRALASHDYPGNIRELENILEYALIMSESGQITRDDLPPQIHEPKVPLLTDDSVPRTPRAATGALLTLEEMEQMYVEEVLRRCGGNQSEAARILGISRTSLWRKLKKQETGEALPSQEPAGEGDGGGPSAG